MQTFNDEETNRHPFGGMKHSCSTLITLLFSCSVMPSAGQAHPLSSVVFPVLITPKRGGEERSSSIITVHASTTRKVVGEGRGSQPSHKDSFLLLQPTVTPNPGYFPCVSGIIHPTLLRVSGLKTTHSATHQISADHELEEQCYVHKALQVILNQFT